MHFLTAPSPSSLLWPHLTPSLVPRLYFPGSTGRVRRLTVGPGSVLLRSTLRNGSQVNRYKGFCLTCSGFLRRCKAWDGEISPLESQILEFMQSSAKPEVFPTKEELVAAGRVDLVEAIVKERGWLAYGWDMNGGSSEIRGFDEAGAAPASGISSSQSDGSVKIEAVESGIEGILSRLDKQRNNSFGFDLDNISFENSNNKDEWDHRTTTDTIAAGLENGSRASSSKPKSSHLSGSQIKQDPHGSQLGTENLRNSPNPGTWRSWIIQRTGFRDTDFEDAEVVPSETEKEGINNDASRQPGILNGREFSSEHVNRETGLYSLDGNANQNDIKSRIQNLESELWSTLHLVRSSSDKIKIQMVQKSSTDGLAKLSDACEFQENEIMNAQDSLRSIRAKLSVLEGKMALAIMDAHKVAEEKQKRVNNAKKALQILKTTCVIWPNNASEVLLAGSFDGWSTKRKMDRLSSGLFCLNLRLYPGKYEMKFIVDGEWKIDPLRPFVTSNGYENNLLIVYES